ncbi:ATP-binding protein [Bradyrhizobium sp. 190]|uniref:sensor histidine kinase n=1 Tax=Bradyrhizobium sp. 190 TaxID=2782658 RepID=UPI001FFAD4E2|nr:ATP-binding protein [Bradyrhizobium sp. 190]MCK1511249.1 ATP-binding protein [Bradyrhizobium sp. 190]
MATSSGLARKFVLAAATTIAVSMGLLALAVSQRIEASMMRTATEEGARFTEVFLGPLAQDLATSRSLSPESMKKLDDLLAGKSGERMILVKIWLPDATLVYSTNKEAIGQRFPSSHITAAVAGKATGEFDYLQDVENAADKHLHTPLVEIYAPLFRTGTQEVIAVGEVYTDGRTLAADLASIRLTSAGIVGAVTAPMMLILFFMVRGASNLVNGYQSTLIQNVVEAKYLAAQNDRLRRLADDARLEAADSNENLLARIGQDLHDGPIQLVSLLMLKVTDPTATKQLETGRGSAHDPAIEPLTRRILTELRNISTGLVLPELEGLTPNEIIRLAVQNHEEVTGTMVSRQIGDLPADLARPVTICLYRIVQEGLNNAFHHGKAIGQRVEVWVEAQSIVIVVSDSGPGVVDSHRESSRSRTGLGIAGLRNRVEALKGTFEVISQRGIGTQIRAKLPVTSTPN